MKSISRLLRKVPLPGILKTGNAVVLEWNTSELSQEHSMQVFLVRDYKTYASTTEKGCSWAGEGNQAFCLK